MSDVVVDSSEVAKWVLPESDSSQAHRMLVEVTQRGEHLVALDLVMPEVANAIWKWQRRKLISLDQAKSYLGDLFAIPIQIVTARPLLLQALEIALKSNHAVYDTLFVALARDLQMSGVTADEPLYHSVHGDYPEIVLLRDW